MSKQTRKDVKVRADRDRLLLDFYYKDRRCREYLNVQKDKEGKKYAERQAKLLEQELLDGTFNFADWFPKSKKCAEFCSVPENKVYTFLEVSQEWKEKIELCHKVGELKFSTLKSYKKGLRTVQAHFGKYEMKDITKSHVQDFMYKLAVSGLAKKTVNNTMTPFRRVFDYAFDEAYIDTNVMNRVKNFSLDLPDIEPFNMEEVNAILAYTAEKCPEFLAMFTVLFHTGMRIGEVLAMKWKNLDTMSATYYVKEHFTEKRLETPKTKKSKRIVSLTDETMTALKTHKPYTFLKSEYMFCNQYGKPWVSSEHVTRTIWEPMLKRLGIAYRVMYQCRHTHASLSILAGDNLAVIAERMGHENIGTLITRYAKYVKAVQSNKPRIGTFLSGFGHELQQGSV